MENTPEQMNREKPELLFVLRAFNLDGLIDGKRMTSIIRNIQDRCRITAVCFDCEKLNRKIEDPELEAAVDTIRVREGRLWAFFRKKVVENPKYSETEQFFRKNFMRLVRKLGERAYDRNYRRHLKKAVKAHPDSMMIVSCGVGESFLLDHVFRYHTGQKLAVDFRDNLFFDGIPPHRYEELKEKTRRAYEEADLVTVVSKGQRDTLRDALDIPENNKFLVLYNGYNRANFREAPAEEDRLTIAYTGTVYRESDAEALCCLLERMIAEETVDKNKIRFVYAGKFGSTVSRIFEAHGLSDLLTDRGMVSRDEVSRIQASADILLVMVINTLHERGSLTGKFPEYIGMKKPILALVFGDLENSEIKEIIHRDGFGHGCEWIGGEAEQEKARQYLLEQYGRKMSHMPLRYDAGEEAAKQFDFSRLADTFYENLIKIRK